MENEVFLCNDGNETCIGTVIQLLSGEDRKSPLEQAIRDVVDELVFDDNNQKGFAVFTLEIR